MRRWNSCVCSPLLMKLILKYLRKSYNIKCAINTDSLVTFGICFVLYLIDFIVRSLIDTSVVGTILNDWWPTSIVYVFSCLQFKLYFLLIHETDKNKILNNYIFKGDKTKMLSVAKINFNIFALSFGWPYDLLFITVIIHINSEWKK